MTHGCGSVSSAGASSFSSFNAGTTAAIVGASSARNSSGSDDDACEECCACTCLLCCTGLGYLLCIKKMTKSSRIQLTWFWVLLIGVSLGLTVGVGVYGARKSPASFTDMRIVENSYSTFMCTAFTIDASEKMDVFLLPEKPSVNVSQRQTYNMTSHMDIPSRSYEYWGFYLLKGSRITVFSCYTGSSLTLKIIKGFDNLQTWIADDSCRDCVLESHSIHSFRFCIFELFDYDKYKLSISASDDYYFVYVTSFSSADVTAEFYVDRTLYDVSSAIRRCTGVNHCFFELSYQSAEVVVYHIGTGATPMTVETTTHCLPQAGLYIAFFVVPPIVVGVLLTILIRKKCADPVTATPRRRNRTRVQLRHEGPSARTPLLSSSVNPREVVTGQPRPGVGTPLRNPVAEASENPPKYEDIERQEPPPTYEESLNIQRK